MALLTNRPTTDRTTPQEAGSSGGVRTEAPQPVVAEVRDHHRSFGRTQVLRGVDLTVRRGEFVALLGRSGSGKSTLLRSLAGLDPVAVEQVRVSGRSSVSFQEPRLLPWRRVGDNVGLALLNTVRRGERAGTVRSALAEVHLSEKADAWPGQLSGGQAQRVSLARALVSEPDLLLLDEPFSALDALTRIEMHRLVTQLWRRHRPAVLLVTHDVDEALALADRVLVLDQGRIARRWEVEVARDTRTPQHPRIAQLRTEVLDTLGVTAGQATPHETEHATSHATSQHASTQESGAA